jgi:hypothetical protein
MLSRVLFSSVTTSISKTTESRQKSKDSILIGDCFCVSRRGFSIVAPRPVIGKGFTAFIA